jgi:hypothetical protein
MLCYNRAIEGCHPRVSAPMALACGDASMSPIIPQKQCTKCKQCFDATPEFFHRNKTGSMGLNASCKLCVKLASRNYYENNKERILVANIEWKIKHPEEFKAMQDAYVDRNPDKVKASKKQYYVNNSDYVYEQVKRRRNESPEKYNAHKAVQIAVKNGSLPLVKTQTCELCGNTAQHYHHWSYLLEHQLDVIPLCAKCHRKEHVE